MTRRKRTNPKLNESKHSKSKSEKNNHGKNDGRNNVSWPQIVKYELKRWAVREVISYLWQQIRDSL